ncbi:protoporphyrinogen oxidase [Alpinimonas psychrophila]|uniref:Coproporphyrinogen III oxidase n=1 Tax=Alpinimonas psychrophila TaxID=748908 RepID=A0A7W3JVJ3_9MICO|nr:oxygen-dependent protoporphyrinogen oxidase [Alpinimonas psychrophila]
MKKTGVNPLVDIVVIGGGIAGLVAADVFARAGLSVTLIEERATVGGLVTSAVLDGLRLDVGAEAFATREGSVSDLAIDLGLADDLVRPDPAGAWIRMPTKTVRIPRLGILGIPGNPLARDVRAAIGLKGAIRASFDRVLPRGFAAESATLGELVRKRMGQRVVDRLVAPICLGIHSTHPNSLDIDAVAPSLREGLRRTGSLVGAVKERATTQRAGGAVMGLDGGLWKLTEALHERIVRNGGNILTSSRVTSLAPAGRARTSAWQVGYTDMPGMQRTVRALGVLFAVPALQAQTLLRENLTEPQSTSAGRLLLDAKTEDVTIVTLVLISAALDAHPRGSGIIVAPESPGVRAKALTHSSSKWPWLASVAGAGRHAIRLSYSGSQLSTPAKKSASIEGSSAASIKKADAELVAKALADASVLLGVELSAGDLRASRVTRWSDAVTPPSPAHRELVRAWTKAVARLNRIGLTGSWIAGTGLASVIPHSQAAADQLIAGLQRPS